MTGQPAPRRELERTRDSAGPGADQARIALAAEDTSTRLRAAIVALASARGVHSSTCPSDAARAVADDWRPLLPQARALARELARTGVVRLLQRGRTLDPDGDWRGPIRVRLSQGVDE
jgi:hypothetical protein